MMANVIQRFASATRVESKLIEYTSRFGVLDDPIGDAGV